MMFDLFQPKRLSSSYDAVVMVTVKKDGSHKFIYSASGTNVRITPILKGAHKFKNLYAAQQTAKRLARRFDSYRL